MGMARLLAKGWVTFCLFAGAHALHAALARGVALADAASLIGICALLFAAMGLLFAGGYAAGSDHGHPPFLQRMKPHHLFPGFNEIVFVFFVAMSFAVQVFFAPQFMQGDAVNALKAAVAFAVPGQHALQDTLQTCGLDGGRIFASAFTWFLAFIYVGSAMSHLKLTAGLIRLERDRRPEALGPTLLALLLGVASVVGFQFLYVGSAYRFVPCGAYTETAGAVLIGLAPLMLAYLIMAALANLRATGPE
jgi:hypothetical protein